MENSSVGDFMKRSSHWLPLECSLEEVVRYSQKTNQSFFPAVKSGKVKGLFNLSGHSFESISGEGLRLPHRSEVLFLNPLLVSPRAPLMDVFKEMVNGSESIAVVTERQKPVGLLFWNKELASQLDESLMAPYSQTGDLSRF